MTFDAWCACTHRPFAWPRCTTVECRWTATPGLIQCGSESERQAPVGGSRWPGPLGRGAGISASHPPPALAPQTLCGALGVSRAPLGTQSVVWVRPEPVLPGHPQVAMRPRYLDAGEVPAAVLEEQKAIFASQGEQMGKPAHVVAKMAEGRVRKWQGEVCLAMQPFVVDPDTTVEKALAKRGLRVTGFARVEVGEGIEADAGTGFADEVRRLASGAKS